VSAIECITLLGHKRLVQPEKLILYPAAYGLIVNEGQVLLLKMRHTGKFHLPGGGINLGERMKDALQREVREETGIEIEVGKLVDFNEFFFYYDPSGKAYHGLFFYYFCRPKSLDLLDDGQVDDEAAEKPRWIEIQGLQAQDFQSHGERILELVQFQ
jgi:8-oxo-dGTP pyrophosphatase MutT (NUDIX family)